jgi:hypothetical protein
VKTQWKMLRVYRRDGLAFKKLAKSERRTQAFLFTVMIEEYAERNPRGGDKWKTKPPKIFRERSGRRN